MHGQAMKRREFIALVGTAATWPLAARAQQPERIRRIGILTSGATADDPDGQTRSAAFLQGLEQLGWIYDRNIRIDYRWGAGDADGMRKYAAELVTLAPDVIVASGTATVAPLLQATRNVPIVFVQVADPVGAGFVDSLARARWQRHRFYSFRVWHQRKMAGAAQGNCAGRDARGHHSRPRANRWDWPVRRNPVRGAVGRGGGELNQHEQRRRDRARHCSLCAFLEWRANRDGERVVGCSSRSDHHARGSA
jgi:hypothetical protein